MPTSPTHCAAVALPAFEDVYRDRPIGRTAGGLRFIDLSDEFTTWLGYANAGMLNRGNLACLDYVLRHLSSGFPMVEIGAFCGLSTNLIHHLRRRHGRQNALFNCDRWEFENAREFVGDSPLTHADYRRFVRETYRRNVEFFSRDQLPFTAELLSDEFFAAWADERLISDLFGRRIRLGGPISFCFIDGNHSYEFARRDFENADRFLEPGGYILFDDSADGSKWEVTRVVEEVKRSAQYRVVAANPNYLVQKIR